MLRRIGLLVILLPLFALLPVLPAEACSCIPRSTDEMLASADAALIGDAVAASTRSDFEASTAIRVTHDLNDNLDPVVVVHHSTGGAPCGLSLYGQEHVALALDRSDEGWSASYCRLLDEIDILAAGAPLASREPDVVPLDRASSWVVLDPELGWLPVLLFAILGAALVIAVSSIILQARRSRGAGRGAG
ncbi:MAG: hypothetical protein WD004_00880 [Actinomycetota bacterium]